MEWRIRKRSMGGFIAEYGMYHAGVARTDS